MGFDVDDDNQPAEENIPTQNQATADGLKEGQSFGWNGFDERKKERKKDCMILCQRCTQSKELL